MSAIVLTSETLIATPAAGNIEYSSPIMAATTIGTQRGIIPIEQYYRLNSAVVGTQVTTAQNTFGVGVTLSASTVYGFEIYVILTKTAGVTSHNIGMGIGGTATINNIGYSAFGQLTGSAIPVSISTNNYGYISNTATSTNIFTGATTASYSVAVLLKGTVSINAGGTFIPQYTLSAAPGGAYSTAIGSFIKIAPIGIAGSNTSVGTWS